MNTTGRDLPPLVMDPQVAESVDRTGPGVLIRGRGQLLADGAEFVAVDRWDDLDAVTSHEILMPVQ